MADQSDRLQDIHLMLGRLEGKVDTFLTGRAEDHERVVAMDQRVGSLERRWAYGLGLGTALSTVVASLVSFISYHWGVKF